MRYTQPPNGVRSLEQRIRNLEGNDGLAQRRRISMALVAVAQMMPGGVVKGGSAMALRYGNDTRFTRDLDAARPDSLEDFRAEFERRLAEGWAGFTGRLIPKRPARPKGIPHSYVMQPFDIRLDYRGQSWCSVPFELGSIEMGDADESDLVLAGDLADMFIDVGLEAPSPLPVMRVDHQIAQKLHAVSAEGSERVRDLVDLQILASHEHLNFRQLRQTCDRLFRFRRQHEWPPTIHGRPGWASLYEEAATGVPVSASLEEAISWVNDLIEEIERHR